MVDRYLFRLVKVGKHYKIYCLILPMIHNWADSATVSTIWGQFAWPHKSVGVSGVMTGV